MQFSAFSPYFMTSDICLFFCSELFNDAVNHHVSIASVLNKKVLTEQYWNNNHKRKLKYSEGNPSQCHFVYQKFYMAWPGSETGGQRVKSGN
jgi:hypothetical protein